MAITKAQAEAKLAAALEAYEKALETQSYSHSSDTDSFSASRQSLADLERAVTFWDRKVNLLSRGGGLTVRRAVHSGN